MHIDGWTLALQTINFAVLVWLLRRFLYRPVLQVVAARKAEVQKQLERAQTIEDQAKAHLAATQAEQASLAAEREASLAAAANEAQEAARVIREQAQRDARALMDSARQSVAAEREQVLEEARRTALDLGADYAHRLLAEVPISLEAWLERVEQHLKALPKSDIDALKRELTDGGSLTVATATELTPAVAEQWRGRMDEALGGSVHVHYEVRPELMAGVELHFRTAVLRCSLQSILATLRAEMDAK